MSFRRRTRRGGNTRNYLLNLLREGGQSICCTGCGVHLCLRLCCGGGSLKMGMRWRRRGRRGRRGRRKSRQHGARASPYRISSNTTINPSNAISHTPSLRPRQKRRVTTPFPLSRKLSQLLLPQHMPSLTLILILILPFSLTTNHTRIPRLHHLPTTTTTTHYLCFNFHICRYKTLNLQISPHGHIS